MLFHPDSVKRIFDTRGFDAVYHDRELWETLGCFWSLASPIPPETAALARLDESGVPDEDVLAFTELPKHALAIAGESVPLTHTELHGIENRYSSRLAGPASHARKLRTGRRYRGTSGSELLEVFFGQAFESPADSGPPIDSVRILRLFLRGDRLLAVDTLFRASGVEEHVDVEPPRLDELNWFETSEQTIGFLSFDRGSSWLRLCVDTGFEGIDWMVWRLGDRSPIWNFYLYTSH
jgi:hypothetical protein